MFNVQMNINRANKESLERFIILSFVISEVSDFVYLAEPNKLSDTYSEKQ